MAFTAFKVNPRQEGKLFVVDVEIYQDGKLIETERYETSQPQGDDWPAELVKRRIENREGVKEMPSKITAGEIDLTGLSIGAK
jgi:hypothetical protein